MPVGSSVLETATRILCSVMSDIEANHLPDRLSNKSTGSLISSIIFDPCEGLKNGSSPNAFTIVASFVYIAPSRLTISIRYFLPAATCTSGGKQQFCDKP